MRQKKRKSWFSDFNKFPTQYFTKHELSDIIADRLLGSFPDNAAIHVTVLPTIGIMSMSILTYYDYNRVRHFYDLEVNIRQTSRYYRILDPWEIEMIVGQAFDDSRVNEKFEIWLNEMEIKERRLREAWEHRKELAGGGRSKALPFTRNLTAIKEVR